MNKLSKCSSLFLILWILTPLEVMVLNAKQVDVYFIYNYWIGFLFLGGIAGWVLGIIYLILYLRQSQNSVKEKLISFSPLFAMLLFGIWCIICAIKAGESGKILIGYMTARDTLFVYFCYAGMVLNGITIAHDKNATKWTAGIFVVVTTTQAIIALLNNEFTTLVSNNERSTCVAYESVYYNTNHYAYYLAISIIIALFMAYYSSHILEKFLYVLSFSILIVTLAENNTMGSLLAVAITLALMVIAFVLKTIKNKDKKSLVLILVVLLAIGITLFYFKDNLVSNSSGLVQDIKSVVTQDERLEGVGSGRGILWETAVQIIKENPIYGKGPQNVTFSAHNSYLQIAMYTGIPGIILYLLIFVAAAISLIKQRKQIKQIQIATLLASICYMISAFFGLTVFYTAPYFYIILGFAISGLFNGKEEIS